MEKARLASPVQTVVHPSGVKGVGAFDSAHPLVPRQPTVRCISNEQCALVPQAPMVTLMSPVQQVSHQLLFYMVFMSIVYI